MAVVVAGLAERQSEVARLIDTTFGDARDVPVWNGGQPLGHDAAIGAAFNALTLLSAEHAVRTPSAAGCAVGPSVFRPASSLPARSSTRGFEPSCARS